MQNDLRIENTAKEMAMDFMEMREALNVAGSLAASGNGEDFYGAWPGAARRVMPMLDPNETESRHAAPTACSIGYDPQVVLGEPA